MNLVITEFSNHAQGLCSVDISAMLSRLADMEERLIASDRLLEARLTLRL